MRAWSVALAAILLLSSSCSAIEAVPGQAPTVSPSSLPDGTPLLVARVTILDAGSGPELCLGGVAGSSPPQCGGPVLRGWTWPSEGTSRRDGVTWGEFAVVGTYAKGDFTVVKRISDAEAARSIPGPAVVDFSSACPEPAGGWWAEDPGRATQETREAVLGLAAELPGYGGAWIDDHGDRSQDPQTTTINVLVTRDRNTAEQRLRAVWGGPLCVAIGAHTEQELLSIQEELGRRSDFLSSGVQVGADGSHVTLEVAHDDGSLQRQLDQRHGAGVVRVVSALRPYRG